MCTRTIVLLRISVSILKVKAVYFKQSTNDNSDFFAALQRKISVYLDSRNRAKKLKYSGELVML
mgnify:CR=1 FL=1